MSTLENLRKSARRWLKALRADDADAHARLRRADPNAPFSPALRDVQHALAREFGHESWIDLRRALDDGKGLMAATPDADQYDTVAKDVLAAYQTGDAAAMQRLQERFRRPVTWETLRAEVDHQLEQLPHAVKPRAPLSLADIRHFMAVSAGFESWPSFLDALRLDGESEANARVAVVVPPQPDPGPSGMLQPVELRITLPMELQGGRYATTTEVWHMLAASRAGDLERIKSLVADTPGLVRCEHNYMPPLHLAVREGHRDLVVFLLERGAFDPEHVTYPYNEKLLTIAEDRDDAEIARLLREYAGKPPASADGKVVHGVGTIQFPADDDVNRLEKLVAANALSAVEKLLERQPSTRSLRTCVLGGGNPEHAGEPRASTDARSVASLRGPRAGRRQVGPGVLLQALRRCSVSSERGMNPNHMNWQRTTLLHDMAWEGDVRKAVLLLDHGADIDVVDDEFRSTPLGIAARWGRREVVRVLLDRGADPNRAGASWATPLAWAVKKGHSDIAAVLRSAGAR